MPRYVKKCLNNEADEHSLIDFILGHSEDGLQMFFDDNFSNCEIGTLQKLRTNKHLEYSTAFMGYSQNGNKNLLVKTLQELTKELLQKNSFAQMQEGSDDERKNGYLVAQVTRKQNLESSFNMVVQSWFAND